MYNCPRCKIPINEIVVGEYKCPECNWHLSERYVQAWWDGYNACAAEHHAHLTQAGGGNQADELQPPAQVA